MASRAVEYTDSWVLLSEAAYEVDVLLRYEDSQPLEVIAMYENVDGVGVCHHFSRDLLGAGLGVRAGEGLVQVAPHKDGASIYVVLADGHNDEWWCFLAPRRHVELFLAETLRLVPRDQEPWMLDIPDYVDELLDEEISDE